MIDFIIFLLDILKNMSEIEQVLVVGIILAFGLFSFMLGWCQKK